METNWRYHLPAEKRREKPSADSNPVKEKSLARSTSIVNKKEHTRTETKTKKVMDTGIHSIYTTRGAR